MGLCQDPCAGITQIRFNGYNLRPNGPPHDRTSIKSLIKTVNVLGLFLYWEPFVVVLAHDLAAGYQKNDPYYRKRPFLVS